LRFLEVIGGWINRHFSNEEAIYLVVLLAAAFLLLITLGDVLAPVLMGLVFAFLLQGLVVRLTRLRVPESIAVYLTFLVFLGGLVGITLFVIPLAWRQLSALINALPQVVEALQASLRKLPEAFPNLVTDEQVDIWLEMLGGEIGGWGGAALEGVVGQVPSVLGLTLFLVLVPISVFFFLRDRQTIMAFFTDQLPVERRVLNQVGSEMNAQIANYVRGKFAEIVIVGAASYITFTLMGLNYAALLALLVGLSVIVPYVGAAVVTIPVAAVAYVQLGWTWEFGYLMAAYTVIQVLDGNVLVPLLFSEAVDLHPIAIIVAVLAFGGIWGFWGVFFAIPLATLVKAVMNAWPSQEAEETTAAA
jgi:putative permease